MRIGALFDLSGPERLAGNAMLLGASSAVRYFNQRLARMGYEIELSVKDTGSQEGSLLLGAMGLDKDRGVIALIGPVNHRLVKTVMGYAEAHSLPLVLTAGRHPLNPTPWYKIKWTFGISPPIGHMSKAFFRDLRKRGIKKIGVLVDEGHGFDQDIPWIKAYGVESRIEVLDVEGFSTEDVDCVTQLQHLKDLGAELVLYRGDSRFLPRLFKSLDEAPLTVAFLMDTPLEGIQTHPGINRSSVLVQSPLLFLDDYLKTVQRPAIVAFKAAMETTSLHSRHEILAAAKAWDAVGLIVSAILNGAAPNRAGLLRVFSGRYSNHVEIRLTYHGLLGDFTPDRRDHCGLDTRDLHLLPLD